MTASSEAVLGVNGDRSSKEPESDVPLGPTEAVEEEEGSWIAALEEVGRQANIAI